MGNLPMSDAVKGNERRVLYVIIAVVMLLFGLTIGYTAGTELNKRDVTQERLAAVYGYQEAAYNACKMHESTDVSGQQKRRNCDYLKKIQ